MGSALFLEFLAGFLPRALGSPGDTAPGTRGRGWAGALLRAGTLAAGSPLSLGFTTAVIGLGLGMQAGGAAGLMPTVGYAACLILLCLLIPYFLSLRLEGSSWRLWFLTVPGGFLVAGSIAGGWVLTGLASAIAFSGATVPVAVTAPDPLLVQLPGILYPQGYLALLALLVWVAVTALRYAAALPVVPAHIAPSAGAPEAAPRSLVPAVDLSGVQSAARWALRAVTVGLELSERELAERPVWLWLSTAAAIAWLMAQR